MLNIIQYQTHLVLVSKYFFIVKLMIIFSVYAIFYLENYNEIAHCAPTKKQLLENIVHLQNENTNLKTELNRFSLSSGMEAYQSVSEETLESLKQKIEVYRLKNQDSFLTIEEQEGPKPVRRSGALRPDIVLTPEFYNLKKYEDVTNNFRHQDYLNQYGAQGLNLERKYIDETGKEIAQLHKTYRINGKNWRGLSNINQTTSWFFYDYKEYYKEIFYPPNHPDNNFDPQCKRLHRITGYKFYEKQLPDKIEENCNIS